MGFESNIGWTTHTFNPVIGCTKVSAACDFCYAETYAKTYEPLVTWGKPGQKSKLRRTAPSNWHKPIVWNKKADSLAAAAGMFRQRVFCASLSDVFDSDWEPEWRWDLWALIEATPNLDWLLLTKRPQNAADMVPVMWRAGWPSNVWLGTTAENQTEYDRRWAHLLAIPAALRFISYEPALGPLVIPPGIVPDWIICGGESGSNRRPFDLKWATDLQAQCALHRIPFFFKQDSSFKPGIRGRASDDLWACKQIPGQKG